MSAQPEDRPRRFRGRHLETHRFRFLLATLVTLMGAQALGIGQVWGGLLLAPIGVSVLAATLFVLSRTRAIFWTAVVLVLPTFLQIVLRPSSTGFAVADLGGSSLHAPFFCLAAVALLSQVVRSERADEDTVVGSVCAYLFIALAFASLFTALEAWSPGAFRFGGIADESLLFDEHFYFSLVTVTTLGYGDIVPVSAMARSLVTLESVYGILFPSIVIARIISLYTVGGGRPFARLGPLASRRPGRFVLLLVAEIVLLSGTPGLESGSAARAALSLLTTILLLAALYAGSDRGSTRTVGIALATLALAGRWWPESGAPWIHVGGAILEAAFLALVSGSLLVWLIREKQVTRDLLVASIATYLLLGLTWASIFSLVELLSPGSLATPTAAPMSRSDLVYYSFMTLTTTGFGDIAPLTSIAKRIATFESLVGILYPTVLVARLVSLYQTE